MLSFALAVLLLVITPGPGVLSLAGVGSAFGRAAGWRYLWGLFLGNNLVSLAVVSGLAALVLAHDGLRVLLLAASTAYLLYLAARIAFAGAQIAFITRSDPPGLRGGLALQVINPKAYAVGTALFSGFGFMPEAPLWEVAIKFVLLNAVWLPVHAGWLQAGLTLRRLSLPPRTQRIINIVMALALLTVVALAVLFALRAA